VSSSDGDKNGGPHGYGAVGATVLVVVNSAMAGGDYGVPTLWEGYWCWFYDDGGVNI
jgi:hypothetical protein